MSRRLSVETLEALGRIVEAELSAKLFPVSIRWQELRASDLQTRACSVDSLVKVDVKEGTAMEIAGLSV